MHKFNRTAPATAPHAILTALLLSVTAIISIALVRTTGAQTPILRVAAAAAAAAPTSTPAPACQPFWFPVDTPRPSPSSAHLTDVQAIAANDIWAVGYYSDPSSLNDLTYAMHWDGAHWNIVSTPSPGTYNNHLAAISGVASNDIWAVGDYNNDPAHPTRHLLTIHWDGTRWSVVPNPDPGGNYDNYLTAVDARASNDVWAVGFYRRYSPLSLVTHWDGVAWSDPGLMGVSGSVLSAVKTLASDNAWAVGYNGFENHALILRYDGASWTEVPSAAPDANIHLYGIDAAMPDDIWATGGDGSSQSVAEHWNGTSWSFSATPNVGILTGVEVISADDVWAVGYDNFTQFIHWDGTQWSIVIPGDSNQHLLALSAVYANDIWAVGGEDVPYSSNYSCDYLLTPTPTKYPTIVGATPTNTAVPTSTAIATNTNTPQLTQTPGGATATNTPANLPTNTSTDTPVATDTRAATNTATETFTATVTGTPPTATSTPTACTLAFEDVPPTHTFYAYIQCLACKGIINGYPCGSPGEPCNSNQDPYFRPGNDVSREQFSKIASNSAGFQEPAGAQQYQDVAVGSTFYDFIWRLSNRGYINGYPCGGPGEPCGSGNLPYFRPNANVTRGQLSKIDANAADFVDVPGAQQYEDVVPGSTFYDYIWRLTNRGIMNGYPCGGVGEPCGPNSLPYFRPGANATRGQASKIVSNTFFPSCNP